MIRYRAMINRIAAPGLECRRGTLKQNEFAASEEDLLRYLRTHLETKPHLKHADWQLSSKGSGTAEPLQHDDLAVFFDPALTCPCDPSGE